MDTQPPRDDPEQYADVEAEHRALKQQMAALRAEHDRLHTEGGTKEEHQQHLRNLHEKLRELEHHIERLKSRRHTTP